MGYYINIGNAAFQSVRNGEYVDKSGLIAVVNNTLFSERRYSCVIDQIHCQRLSRQACAMMPAECCSWASATTATPSSTAAALKN